VPDIYGSASVSPARSVSVSVWDVCSRSCFCICICTVVKYVFEGQSRRLGKLCEGGQRQRHTLIAVINT